MDRSVGILINRKSLLICYKQKKIIMKSNIFRKSTINHYGTKMAFRNDLSLNLYNYKDAFREKYKNILG